MHHLLLKICGVLFWRGQCCLRRGCSQPTPPSRRKWMQGQSRLALRPPQVPYSHEFPPPGTKDTVSNISHNLPCTTYFFFFFLPHYSFATICSVLCKIWARVCKGTLETLNNLESAAAREKRQLRLTQRKVNHVYFWESVAWALAIGFLILQPVICVHSRWVTAPIFSSLIAFSITVQLWTILMCSLSVFHSPLMNLPLVSALVYERSNGANPTNLQIRMYFLSSLPSSPAHRVWPKSSPLWDSQPPSVLTAPALPKVWPQETYPFSKCIRDSSITEARVQINAVFLETSQSRS